MTNLIKSIEHSLSQLFDSAFLKVFILGMITTLAALVAAYFAGKQLIPYLPGEQMFEWQWLQDIVDGIRSWLVEFLLIFAVMFFFAPISMVFMTLYLDDIVDAVEDKHYSFRLAGKRLGLGRLAYLGVRLAFMMLLLNILVIPFYVIFFWTGFIPLVIFYGLNSYLLGWGYYEMVAVRHLGVRKAGRHRKSIRGQVLFGGLVITLLYSVPFVNLVAPILGAAMLTHLFHLSMTERDEMEAVALRGEGRS